MSLDPDAFLNHYQIVSRLGEGGMGEVYRARDTRLGRDVAIKVLPKRLSENPDSLARFEREARVLASLDHPTIGALFDLQESNGTRFLVLQLVEGPTLEERLRRGPMPLPEALPIFAHIAEALQVAHAKGIVHRDLKPANVKLSGGGVKVLDFGLAKAAAPSLDQDSTVLLGSKSSATVKGTVLGTAAYMSPEQARGEVVDERTDIWSFGCCLYEALVGRRTFPGETLSETLVEVLQREVDFSVLPKAMPANLRVLLRRCLERDRSRRLQAIGDARLELQETMDPPGHEPPASAVEAPSPRSPLSRWSLPLAAAALGGLVGAAGLYIADSRLSPALVAVREAGAVRPVVARLDVELPASAPLRLDGGALALSPDGEILVYAGMGEGLGERLFRRDLRSLAVEPLAGSEAAVAPFFSPDGATVGFVAERRLQVAPLQGGTAETLAVTGAEVSAWWGREGGIAASLGLPNFRGLSLVAGTGSSPESLTTLQAAEGELAHLWPQLLPGDQEVLFTAWRGPALEQQAVVVASLRSGDRRVLVRNAAFGRHLASGHLLFVQADGLYVAPLTADHLELAGVPKRVDEEPLFDPRSGLAQLAVADDGTLVYVPSSSAAGERRLLQVGEAGDAVPLSDRVSNWRMPRLSPDGRFLAVTRLEHSGSRLAIYDRVDDAWNEIPFAGPALSPAWSPDGQFLVFAGLWEDRWALYRVPLAEPGAAPAPLAESEGDLRLPCSFSPDGRLLSVAQMRADNNGWDIWVQPLDADAQADPLIVSPAMDVAPAFSPDGATVAYVSDESGAFEVYLKAYPGPSQRVKVSIDGGSDPRWDPRSANRLLFRNPRGEIVAVSVEGGAEPRVGEPQTLASGVDLGLDEAAYDVLPSGDLVLVEAHPPITSMRFVLGWFLDLERLVPIRPMAP